MKAIKESFLWKFIKKCISPLLFSFLLVITYFFYTTRIKSFLDERIIGYIHSAAKVLVILLVTFFVQRLSSAFFEWYAVRVAQKTRSKLDEEFLPFFNKVIAVMIWVIGLVIGLSSFGINVNALIAALGVSSLAIALAAQDTIANIISGFLILIDRPFKVGDTIKLPSGEKVTVVSIGMRRSQFLSEDEAVIFVPNLDLSKSKIVNYSLKGVK